MRLDEQQSMAVRTDSRRVLVIAGPGSGKTRCIVERAAYLIEECKTSPYEIFMVTFTRKAANEMRERLIERIGNKAYHCTIGTFHALALNLLLRFGDVIGYRAANSTVYGEFEEQFLLKEVARDMGIYNGKSWKIPKGIIDAAFFKFYQEGIEPDELSPAMPIFKAFLDRCRENNSYTYGSILTHFRILLPHIHQYLHYKHIFLDEAHDADRLQWELVNSLSQYCNASLYAIADLDQSIYSWRGACPEYLVDHQHEFMIHKLETNYRSAPEIVEAANRLIDHNRDRITKTMKAARSGDGEWGYLRDMDSTAIVRFLKEGSDSDRAPVAVLARTHSLLGKLDTLMAEAGIPHTYIGQTTALTNSEPFRRFHAFLKLCVNPYDNFSFLLIKDVIGLQREVYAFIRLRAANDGMSHFQVYEKTESEGIMEGWWLADSLQAALSNITMLFPDLSPEAAAFVAAWIKDHESDSIADYLAWLATYDIQDEIRDTDTKGITLMTIHAAKGLEWPVVIVAGCNEGILPSKQAIASDDVEAERRLAYVAWTRARDQLVLAVRPEIEIKGDREYRAPASRFIAESMEAQHD